MANNKTLILPFVLLVVLLVNYSLFFKFIDAFYTPDRNGSHLPTYSTAWEPPRDPSCERITGSKDTVAGSISPSDNNTNRKGNWPVVPRSELGHPLVEIGHSFVQNARALLMEEWDAFFDVYRNRPDRDNKCGIRINHAYALWLTCKQLQPTTVFESGVNAGQSTYFLRAALPNATIYCLDPLAEPVCDQATRWIDSDSNKTIYLTGSNFTDLRHLDWGKLKQDGLDTNRTLVFMDDHQAPLERIGIMLRQGIHHLVMEDNYKLGGGHSRLDREGFTFKQLFSRKDVDSEYMYHNVETYDEFPPLVPSTMASAYMGPKRQAYIHPLDDNLDVKEPILRPDLNKEDMELYLDVCRRIGLNSTLIDTTSYMNMMNYNYIAYIKLLPFSPNLLTYLRKV